MNVKSIKIGKTITFVHPDLGEAMGKIRTMSPNGSTLFVEVCGQQKLKFVAIAPNEVTQVLGDSHGNG